MSWPTPKDSTAVVEVGGETLLDEEGDLSPKVCVRQPFFASCLRDGSV